MSIRNTAIISSCILVGALSAFSQIVSFNTPSAWLTQRNDSIMVRAQIDTSQVKKKPITLSIVLVQNGKKSTLATKSFKVTDYSGEFFLGNIKKDLVGGSDFLQLNWQIPGTTNKGSVSPIGIVNVDKMPKNDPVKVTRVKDGADFATVAGAVADANFGKLGGVSFGLVWNKDALYIVTKKAAGDSGIVRFVFDGKSAKNAFLSYPDRIVSYKTGNDSVWASHYIRSVTATDSLLYTEKKWDTEISKSKVADKIVIRVPWYDSGILPFELRTIGLGMFAFGKAAQPEAIPATAKFYIPGTWGDVILEK